MTTRLRPDPAYKDSGLPWLGAIPARWEVRRNGRLFAERNETGFGDLPILEVSLHTGVRVRDSENSACKQVMSDRGKYKRAARGDIAYNMMRMWQGAVGAAPMDGLVSPAYVVARPFSEVDSRYFTCLFRTGAYMNEVNQYSRGIVTDRNRLDWDEFKQMPSVCPPPDEQRAIANVVDQHGRWVRQYVRNKRRLVELLNEQKQAVIQHAVTRGLDANVRLKPSGTNWLWDMPEHWQVLRLRRIADVRLSGVDKVPSDRETAVRPCTRLITDVVTGKLDVRHVFDPCHAPIGRHAPLSVLACGPVPSQPSAAGASRNQNWDCIPTSCRASGTCSRTRRRGPN